MDTDARRYRIEGRDGVAWWTDRACQDHDNCVLMVMVGDDHRWHTDMDDLIEIEDAEYCSGCGQIGCGHGSIEGA